MCNELNIMSSSPDAGPIPDADLEEITQYKQATIAALEKANNELRTLNAHSQNPIQPINVAALESATVVHETQGARDELIDLFEAIADEIERVKERVDGQTACHTHLDHASGHLQELYLKYDVVYRTA